MENRSKLDFCGDRCVWNGAFINKNITGNSALYIYCEVCNDEVFLNCDQHADVFYTVSAFKSSFPEKSLE